jgi:hypothetical protein
MNKGYTHMAERKIAASRTFKDVPVLDANGNVIGHVSKTATSIAASKIAKAPVSFRRVGRHYVWQVMEGLKMQTQIPDKILKDADKLKSYTVRFSKGYLIGLWAKNEADARRKAEECAYDKGRSDEKVTSVLEDTAEEIEKFGLRPF